MDEDTILTSRFNFIGYLSEQVSINTGESLYDKNGTIARAALMGVPKTKIESLLNDNAMFRENVELSRDTSVISDPIQKARALQFRDFYEALLDMEDPTNPVSVSSIVAEMLSGYSDVEDALYEIEHDGSPKDIFDALKKSDDWKEAARDYVTRDYVDLPTKAQRRKWMKFQEALDAIKDLKYLN